jgi:hypothetical protein
VPEQVPVQVPVLVQGPVPVQGQIGELELELRFFLLLG